MRVWGWAYSFYVLQDSRPTSYVVWANVPNVQKCVMSSTSATAAMILMDVLQLWRNIISVS